MLITFINSTRYQMQHLSKELEFGIFSLILPKFIQQLLLFQTYSFSVNLLMPPPFACRALTYTTPPNLQCSALK